MVAEEAKRMSRHIPDIKADKRILVLRTRGRCRGHHALEFRRHDSRQAGPRWPRVHAGLPTGDQTRIPHWLASSATEGIPKGVFNVDHRDPAADRGK